MIDSRRGVLDVAERLWWYVLVVQPQKEFAVQEILERKGLRTFVPLRREWRRKNKYTREKTLHAYPIAPRYVFVGFEPGRNLWLDLQQLEMHYKRRIVTGIVGMGNEPRRLKTDSVVSLIKRFGGGLNAPSVQRYMLSNKEFAVGDLVEVIDGPFTGLKVPVQEIRGAKARLLLDLFGSRTEAELPLDILQAA